MRVRGQINKLTIVAFLIVLSSACGPFHADMSVSWGGIGSTQQLNRGLQLKQAGEAEEEGQAPEQALPSASQSSSNSSSDSSSDS